MKKIIVIILGLFLVLGIAGCNSDGSEMDINLDEFIAKPTNLTIVGTTLSWNEVEDASGYIVYANDEEVDKIKTNSFDFSSLTGDVLVFQVRTRAPRGMQDSPLSVKLAYVVNKTEEVASVRTALAQSNMPLSDEFAEELVNKGMLSLEVQALVDEMDNFGDSMDDVDSFEGMMLALRALVGEMDNIEAVVSAFVKTELVPYLEELIEMEESNIDMWENEFDDPYNWYDEEYVQEKIDSIQMQIDAYEDLIDEIEADPDSIVLAITSTINYFISVEAMISDDLISLIDGLAETDSPSDLSAAELLNVKTEIVYVLRETMPTEEEVTLVMELVDLVSSLSGTTLNYDTAVENYKGKMAAQTLYSVEAFTNFLDVFDEAFFEEFLGFVSDEEMSDEMMSAEMFIMIVEYFNTFYDDNQDLFDTIGEIFTEEEQEALFDEYITVLSNMEGQEDMEAMFTSMDFQQLLDLQMMFEDSFGVVLDAFVESDGEIVRQIAISNTYYAYDLVNEATGETYANRTRVYEARELTNLDVMSEALYLVDAFLQSLDADGLNEMTSFLLDSIFESILAQFGMMTDMRGAELPFTTLEITAAKDAIAVGLEAANQDILTFSQNLVEYMVDEEVLQQYKVVLGNIHSYYATEYGSDYDSDYNLDMYMDDYSSNAELIFVAGVYDDFMTSRNRGTLDDILVVVFDTLGDADLLEITGLSTQEVTDMETAIADVLDLFNEDFANLKDLDYTNLNAGDLADIEAFKTEVETAVMAIYFGDQEKY
ncbi:MAG: hypothetical protein JEZ05_02395 [Tenericutes bacterium]|nr:hypothetical protein [Mycoplasmatota bacterium]